MKNWTKASTGGCTVGVILALVFGGEHDLKTSEQGLTHTANYEGCRTQSYQCSADKWTAGLGHTDGVEKGDVATNKQIANWFVEDVREAEQVVNRHLHADVTQAQYDMNVSFVYNLGAGNYTRSTFLKKFNNGDPVGACNELPRWVYVNGKNCRIAANNCGGIPTRRDREQQICLHGYD